MGQQLPPHQNELYHRIDEVLHYIWDPIGVAGVPEARNEYHLYLLHVFSMLVNRHNKGEIANYLYTIQEERMGIHVNENTRKQTKEIEEILRNYKEVIYEQKGIHE